MHHTAARQAYIDYRRCERGTMECNQRRERRAVRVNIKSRLLRLSRVLISDLPPPLRHTVADVGLAVDTFSDCNERGPKQRHPIAHPHTYTHIHVTCVLARSIARSLRLTRAMRNLRYRTLGTQRHERLCFLYDFAIDSPTDPIRSYLTLPGERPDPPTLALRIALEIHGRDTIAHSLFTRYEPLIIHG